MFKLNIHEMKFFEWHAADSKFLVIAAGGSIYVLALLARLELRRFLTSMKGLSHMDLSNVQRCPPKDKPLVHIVTLL